MATYQPARRPRTRKRRPRPPRRNRRPTRGRALPALHWGWYATGGITVLAAAKSWPAQTGAALAVLAVLAVLSVVQPARHTARPGPRTPEAFYQLTPEGFEHAIADLARADRRVRSAIPVGGSGDGGIDVRVELHTGARWFIQCKRNQYGNNVGPSVIRDANGSYRELHGCHHAAVITTADFTEQAKNTNDRFEYPLALFTGQDVEAWARGGPAPWDRRLRRG